MSNPDEHSETGCSLAVASELTYHQEDQFSPKLTCGLPPVGHFFQGISGLG